MKSQTKNNDNNNWSPYVMDVGQGHQPVRRMVPSLPYQPNRKGGLLTEKWAVPLEQRASVMAWLHICPPTTTIICMMLKRHNQILKMKAKLWVSLVPYEPIHAITWLLSHWMRGDSVRFLFSELHSFVVPRFANWRSTLTTFNICDGNESLGERLRWSRII